MTMLTLRTFVLWEVQKDDDADVREICPAPVTAKSGPLRCFRKKKKRITWHSNFSSLFAALGLLAMFRMRKVPAPSFPFRSSHLLSQISLVAERAPCTYTCCTLKRAGSTLDHGSFQPLFVPRSPLLRRVLLSSTPLLRWAEGTLPQLLELL